METRQSTTQGNLLGTSEGERRTTNNDERRRLYGEQIIYDGGGRRKWSGGREVVGRLG